MENKVKHLELILNVINRMNSNSFLIKGWSITFVSALFAFAAKDANTHYVLVSFVTIPTFWVLDGFYIFQERQYRDLYNEVQKANIEDVNFSMDTSNFSNTWISGIFSKTLIPFYMISIIATLIVMFLIKK